MATAPPAAEPLVQPLSPSLLEPAPTGRSAAAVAAPTPAPASPTAYPPVERDAAASLPTAELRAFLDGPTRETRDRLRAILSRPEFRYPEGERDVAAFREQVLTWCRLLADEGVGKLAMPGSVGGRDDSAGQLAAFETLAFHDISLVIKFGVQFGLYAGSILHLGTERHHQKYLPAAISLRTAGAFAMTEIGHGSNVKEIETTAAYDRTRQAFVLHSPTPSSGKNYVGNVAAHGRLATVFAQLTIDERPYGVHAFVVPIRDEQGRPRPGVRIADNGLKLGLNGVDNGRLWFDHVVVPREDLLDRYAQVAADGTYASPIQSESARFFTMLGTLVGGRVSVGAAGVSAAKSGLTIAVRYAARRRQFGPGGGAPETLLLDYPTHQRRLLPLLANAYALHFAAQDLSRRYVARTPADVRSIETHAAAFKAFSTWNTTHTLQVARECCGGEGYIAANRLGDLKADTEIFTTFEGDNTVLIQLAAKNLLADLKERVKEMGPRAIARLGVRQTFESAVGPRWFYPTAAGHVRTPEFSLSALRYREQALLLRTGAAFRRARRTTPDSYRVFLELQPELMALGLAFVERYVAETFQEAVEQAAPELRPALGRLQQLFALHRIELHRAWYLENRYFARATSQAVATEVGQLCAEVRREAVELVDAFGIPDSCLAAPIALG